MQPEEIEVEEEKKNLPLTGGQVIGSAATEISAGVTGEIIAGLLKRRSEEHTSELQSQSTISYAVFCLKKKKTQLTKYSNPRQDVGGKNDPLQ